MTDANTINWTVPPEDQGQTIEVGYAMTGDGLIYCRTLDRSDMSAEYCVADLGDLAHDHGIDVDTIEPWNARPNIPVDAWRACRAPGRER